MNGRPVMDGIVHLREDSAEQASLRTAEGRDGYRCSGESDRVAIRIEHDCDFSRAIKYFLFPAHSFI